MDHTLLVRVSQEMLREYKHDDRSTRLKGNVPSARSSFCAFFFVYESIHNIKVLQDLV